MNNILDHSKYKFNTINMWPLDIHPEENGFYIGYGQSDWQTIDFLLLEFRYGEWFINSSGIFKNNQMIGLGWHTIDENLKNHILWTNNKVVVNK